MLALAVGVVIMLVPMAVRNHASLIPALPERLWAEGMKEKSLPHDDDGGSHKGLYGFWYRGF